MDDHIISIISMTQTVWEAALARIKIVLVEPAGALNVGSVARIMKNMGLEQLVLVNPHCDPSSDEARRMAVHAADILEQAVTVGSLPEALSGCQRAIATTARSRSRNLPTDLEDPRQALPWLLERPSALIFGPEDRGLNNEELNYAQRFVKIASSSSYPSLNLAQSVAVCCYELRQQAMGNLGQPVTGEMSLSNAWDSDLEARCESISTDSPVSLEVLEGYYQQLETLLLQIGYLYPHTASSRMSKFRRLFNRASLTSDEVSMLRGILRQVEWALNCNNFVAVNESSPASRDVEADQRLE